MTHSELVESLASYWRSIPTQTNVVLTELTLGSTVTGGDHPGIADVYVRSVSWTQPRIRICEVKAGRSDFLQDVRTGKYLKYVKHCHQLFFAAEHGVISPNEVPERTGLLLYTEDKGWKLSRRALVNPCEPDHKVTLAALFQRHSELHPVKERAQRMAEMAAGLRKKGRALENAMQGRFYLEMAELRSQLDLKGKEVTELQRTIHEVQSVLGIEQGSNYWRTMDALRTSLADAGGTQAHRDRHNGKVRSMLIWVDHLRARLSDMIIVSEGEEG